MSSSALRHLALRPTKHGSRSRALADPGRTSLNPSVLSDSLARLSSMRRCGAAHLQSRSFHPTPTRRVFEPTGALVAGGFGALGGILVTLLLLRKLAFKARVPRVQIPPPLSWYLHADHKTSQDVADMINTAFVMARKTPIKHRIQALREASFHVPLELARITTRAAPHYRLEDMGAMISLPRGWQAETPTKPTVPDLAREARVFLYFPDKSARANAAIVAINAEFLAPQPEDRKPVRAQASEHQKFLLQVATAGMKLRWKTWRDSHPQVLGRIEPGQLPVVFCFRDMASGCLYDPIADEFLNYGESLQMVNLSDTPEIINML